MCGIAGFMVAPGDHGLLNTRAMTAVLAYEMKARGSDATGIFTVDRKRRMKLRKQASAADVFIAGRRGIGENAQTVLIHTRAATQGSPKNPDNNHPIEHGSIIGIHNGIVYNDDQLFEHFKWPRYAEVDSEAIFAALHHLPLEKALEQIDAGWAIAWVNKDDDPRKLWLAKGWSSPLFFAMTKNGSIVFASTRNAVIEAFEYGGVNGRPEVTEAKNGFLAHTDPDNGGLIILPEFDGSGKDTEAPRKKWSTTSGGWNGHYGSDDWEGAAARFKGGSNVTSLPTKGTIMPYERVQVTGDKDKPKIGDRRRYRTSTELTAPWIYEICTAVNAHGVGNWGAISGSETTVHYPKAPETPPLAGLSDPFDDPVDDTTSDTGSTSDDEPPCLDELIARFAGDAYLVDEEEEDDEFKFGDPAEVDDYLVVRKSMFDGGSGYLLGQVGRILDDGSLLVNWRPCVIARDAFFQILNIHTDDKEGAST